MAVRLVFVRHGVTDWNEEGRLLGRSEVPLNERGLDQAEHLGRELAPLQPAEILSSPQRRTRQTAEAIARACGRTVTTDDRLAEVWLRDWQGKTFAELADDPDVHAYLRDPFHTCDEIEPFHSVRTRTQSLIDDLRSRETAGPIILVSHGDPLRIMLADMLGLPPGTFRTFSIDNGSASTVRLGRKKAHVKNLNWRPGPFHHGE